MAAGGIALPDDMVAPQGEEPVVATEQGVFEVTGQGVTELPVTAALAEAEASGAMAAQMAALEAEVAELRGDVARRDRAPALRDQGEGGFPWMYWQRPSTGPMAGEHGEMAGWITLGHGGRTPQGQRDTGMYSRYLAKGMRPMEEYGIAPIPTTPGGNRYISILQQGGAKEFSLSQILAFKWHIRPPIPGLKFPQYEAVKDKVLHGECPSCDFELYAPPGDQLIARAFFGHLQNSHKLDRTEASLELHYQGLPQVSRFALQAAAARMGRMPDGSLVDTRERVETPA